MIKKTKKFIFLIFVIIVAGIIVFNISQNNNQAEYQTIKVARQDLIQSVEATGNVKAAEEIELNFRTTGRIAKILVKEGEAVKTGQRLASLEAGALSSRVLDAQSQLQAAQADLEKVLAGASAAEIEVVKRNAAQKKQALTSAQNDLNQLEDLRANEINKLKVSAEVILNNELATAQAALETVDNVLNDSDAQDTLGVADASTLPQAKISQQTAESAVNQIQADLVGLDGNSQESQVLLALDKMQVVLDKVAKSLADTLMLLQKTVTSNNLSEGELDALKSNVKAEQVKINAARTNIATANANLSQKIIYYQDQTVKAEDKIKAAEQALAVAEAELNLKKTPARPFEIKAAQSRIAQAKAALALAQANLRDAMVIAPLDGVVTKINYQVGEQVNLSQPVVEMISQASFEVEADIPESDIAKIKVGQPAQVTLDAYGDEKVFSAKVVFIDSAETVIQDVVYYQVKIQFEEKCPFEGQAMAAQAVDCQDLIKPGMTANLTILTDKRQDVLVVPGRAVKTRDGEKYIQVLIDGQPVDRNVKIGMRGDDGIEIISGLQAGEEVVTFVKK